MVSPDEVAFLSGRAALGPVAVGAVLAGLVAAEGIDDDQQDADCPQSEARVEGCRAVAVAPKHQDDAQES